jgi:beta-lactamase class A
VDGLRDRVEGIAAACGGTFGVAIEHVQTGWRLSVRGSEPFVAASVIKVPIMAAVYREAAAGRLRLEERLRLRPEDQVLGSGVLKDLSPGLRLTVADLVTLMIAVSDNTATNMLLRRIGVDAVNAAMQAWGLTGSRLLYPLMVVPERRSGFNTVTADDMTSLLVRIARGQCVSWDASRRMIDVLKRQQDNERLPAMLPPVPDGPPGSIPPWEVAHKTGTVTGVAHDVGIVYMPGQAFAISVLTRDVADGARANRAIAAIARAAFDAFASQPPAGEGG